RGWYLVLVVLASLFLTDMRRFFDNSYAGSSWYWIGGAAGTLTAALPFGVAFATWYAGRARRNRLQEAEVSMRWFGLGSHLASLATLIVVLIFTVLPVFGYVSIRTWQNSNVVTGSPPDGPYPWLQIAVILF